MVGEILPPGNPGLMTRYLQGTEKNAAASRTSTPQANESKLDPLHTMRNDQEEQEEIY